MNYVTFAKLKKVSEWFPPSFTKVTITVMNGFSDGSHALEGIG